MITVDLKNVVLATVLAFLLTSLACGPGATTKTPPPTSTEPVETFDFDASGLNRCEESERWSEPKPDHAWIDQRVERDDIAIRLLQGKFTDSGTSLEFLVEYPAEAGALEYNARFRLMDREVKGISTPGQLHFTSTWGCGGQELHVLEGPGTVEDPQQGVRIELPRIARRTGPLPGTPGPATGWEKIEGPWTFSIAPTKSME